METGLAAIDLSESQFVDSSLSPCGTDGMSIMDDKVEKEGIT